MITDPIAQLMLLRDYEQAIRNCGIEFRLTWNGEFVIAYEWDDPPGDSDKWSSDFIIRLRPAQEIPF